MKLYHTSTLEIRKPDLYRGRKNADFGQGFYLTPDWEFSRRWAAGDAVINEYELDERELDIRRFVRDEDWFGYIFHNRRTEDRIAADVIIGPIANDTIFDTLGIISSGFLRPEEALRLLMIGPEYTHVAVKTEKALSRLRWIRAEKAPGQDPALRRAEQEAYARAFAEAMAAFDEP